MAYSIYVFNPDRRFHRYEGDRTQAEATARDLVGAGYPQAEVWDELRPVFGVWAEGGEPDSGTRRMIREASREHAEGGVR